MNRQERRDRMNRPEVLEKPALTYRTEESVHPDQVRLSFSDGSTAIYDLRTELPNPLMARNHEIMKKWKGYRNQPTRRRGKK